MHGDVCCANSTEGKGKAWSCCGMVLKQMFWLTLLTGIVFLLGLQLANPAPVSELSSARSALLHSPGASVPANIRLVLPSGKEPLPGAIRLLLFCPSIPNTHTHTHPTHTSCCEEKGPLQEENSTLLEASIKFLGARSMEPNTYFQ